MKPGANLDAGAELSRCIVALLIKEPYFGHLLGGVVRHVTDDIQTLAVALTDTGVHLCVNPAFFVGTLRRADERTAVVKHEALHLSLRHLFFVGSSTRNQLLFNIAADLVVNQWVKPWPLPAGALTLEMFPDLDLEPDQSLEWYLARLEALWNQMHGQAPSEKATKSEGKRPKIKSPKSRKALERLAGSSWHSGHDGWANSPSHGHDSQGRPSLTSALRSAMQGEVERQIEQAKDRAGLKQWRKLPANLREELEGMMVARRPRVDWRRTLRLFSSSSRRTRVVSTGTRQSKRFDTFPGIKVVKRSQRLAIAVDTSGSIDQEALAVMFAEVHGIWRSGAEIDVIECDAAVGNVWRYAGRPPTAATGRGGTLFDPVFTWLHTRRGVYDGCIYLTDGRAPAPAVRPPCRLLWVVTANGTLGEHLLFGRQLQLPGRQRPAASAT